MCVIIYYMKKFNYKKMIYGEKIRPDRNAYINILKSFYKSDPKALNIKNKDDKEFIIFKSALKKLLNEYNSTSQRCLDLRDSSPRSYLNKFLISEINFSLNIENINSTRRLVKEILKQKNQENQKQKGKKLTDDEIRQIVENMDRAFTYIGSEKTISHETLFALYTIMTSNIDMKDQNLEHGNFYRHDGVSIGGEQALDHSKINSRMSDLIEFINSDELNDNPIIKALCIHYIFEHIHPYFDFNGRMGRMLHLWVLKNISMQEFWKNIYLSESIFAYRGKFYAAFKKMNIAKKLNIDLTIWTAELLEIFIDHNKAYIQMRYLAKESKIKLNQKTRLFIMDIIIKNQQNPGMWFSTRHFKKIYPDYSNTIADRVMKELRESDLFNIRGGIPKEYQLKIKLLKKSSIYLLDINI